jgi:hypothetical protein
MSQRLVCCLVLALAAVGCHGNPPSLDDSCFARHVASACLTLSAQSQADPSLTTPQRGRQAAEEACRLQRGEGCEQLAEMLESGRGGARALDGAVTHRRQGCALGDANACEQLGNMISYAIGTAKDDAAARAAYAKGCSAQRPFSCARLAELPSVAGATLVPVALGTLTAHSSAPRESSAFSLAVIGSDANSDKEQRCREQIHQMGGHIDSHAGTRATLILGSENRLRISTRNEGTIIDRELSHAGVADLCAELVSQVTRTQRRHAGL